MLELEIGDKKHYLIEKEEFDALYNLVGEMLQFQREVLTSINEKQHSTDKVLAGLSGVTGRVIGELEDLKNRKS